VTDPVGGPLAAESAMLGVTTVKLAALDAVPPGAVTLTGPVEDDAGTVAVILVSDFTVKWLAPPPKVTFVAPVNPEPVTVTLMPIRPDAGLNELTTGAAAMAGDAPTATSPVLAITAITVNAAARAA
jgi:hypothetical protein